MRACAAALLAAQPYSPALRPPEDDYGAAVSRVFGRRTIGALNQALGRIPVIREIYSGVRSFSEALFGLLGNISSGAARTARALWLPEIVSTLVVTGLFVLTYRGGTAQAIKAQYVVLGVVMLAVLAFLVGGLVELDAATLDANGRSAFTSEVGFWTAFAIFFPVAAGVSSGANLSGDLEQPARAIPLGTYPPRPKSPPNTQQAGGNSCYGTTEPALKGHLERRGGAKSGLGKSAQIFVAFQSPRANFHVIARARRATSST